MIKSLLWKLIRRQEGAGMVEYGLLIVLVGLVAAAGLSAMGTDLSQFFTDIGNEVDTATIPNVP